MKPLHIGLLVAGAALAGLFAVRLAGPPPVPDPLPTRSISKTSVARPAAASPVAPAKPQSAPEPDPTAVTVTPAPAPIFAEPPHVDTLPKPKPFARPAPKPPSEIARVQPPPPVSYQPAASRPDAGSAQPPASVPEPPHSEPPYSEPPHVDPAPKREEPHRSVALDAGAPITIRLLESLSTEHVNPGYTFQATLADPLVAGGFIIAERGARVSGRVAEAHRAGRFSGVSSIELRLLDFTTSDGQRIAVSTDPWLKRGDSMTRSSAEKIGGGAAIGAAIGAIAGGGVGAVIGAGAGGGLGASAAAATGSKPVSIPSETVIRFRLASKILITERRL